MDLSIIIVSWNVCEDVINCISSIYESDPESKLEIILVDNNSSDKTVEIVSSSFPDVKVIGSKENLGFAAGNNLAIEKAVGNNILFLNPDTLVQPNAIDLLIDYIEENQEIGISGPKKLNSYLSTQPSVRKYPTWKAIFYRYTICKYFGLFRKDANDYRMKDFDYNKTANVDQLIGAAIIGRSEVVKEMGGFDERFFMYYEEVDLCKRIKDAGYRCSFYHKPEIIHLGGQSSSQIPAKTVYMNIKSLILYMKKGNNVFNCFILLLLFKLGILMRQIWDLIFSLFSVGFFFWNKRYLERSLLKLKSSFTFLIKYYLNILFT